MAKLFSIFWVKFGSVLRIFIGKSGNRIERSVFNTFWDALAFLILSDNILRSGISTCFWHGCVHLEIVP